MAIDFPNSPSVNDQYTVGDRTWTWNGTYWQTSTSMSTFTASDSEPVDADAGDIWFDSTIGKTFVNYGGNWVEIGAAGSVVDVIADSDGDTKVQVESSADEDKIRFSAAGTERMIVDSSGNVGVGTTTPRTLLEVKGTSSGSVDEVLLLNADGNAVSGSGARLNLSGGNATTRSVYIEGVNTGGATNAHAMTFGTSDDSASPVERMRIDSSGNVGIGTTSPTKPLHVYHATTDQVARFESGDNRGGIEFADSGTTDAAKIGAVGNDLRVRTGSVDVLTVTDGGRVGIGTTSPSDALDLADGSIRFGEDSSGNALGGPFGINVYNAANTGDPVSFESALYYRTTPNAWSFEDSVGNDILCIDIDGDKVGVNTDSPSEALDVVGKIHATSYVRAGYGNGGVALTHNDGGGNANVTFNHVDRTPEQNGNSARIQVNVDGTSNPKMIFELAENVTNGQTVVASEIMRLDTAGMDVVGNITATGTVTGGSSDERLKTVSGTVSNALEKLAGIRGYHYTLNETAESLGLPQIGEPQVGVLAQEVMSVMPELVTIAPISERDEVEEEYYTVRYERFAPLLIEAIHEQQALIETLTARIEALEAE